MNDTNTKAVENTAIDINPIPYLTWTWLKINKDSVAYDFSLTENPGKEDLFKTEKGRSLLENPRKCSVK